MSLRDTINDALKDAMRAKDSTRLSTLRLINAAIKDRDIALRGNGKDEVASEDEVLGILGKMVKQRHESAKAYEEGARLELAEKERAEIKIIEGFLPKQMNADETAAAVQKAIAKTGAESIRDMGKVMGELKGKFMGKMDFSKVGPLVKDMLG